MIAELVVFVAYVIGGMVQNVAGFGLALVAMPLVTLVMDVQVATPVQALTGLSACIVIFYQHREHWLWWESLPLTLGAIAGIPLGTYALTSLPQSLVLGCLAVVVLGYACFDLITTRHRSKEELIDEGPDEPSATKIQAGTAGLVGLMAGILGGAYATGGPPVVIYAAIRGWHKERFKCIIQSLFIFSGTFLLFWQALHGLITRAVGWNALFAFPGLFCGMLIGRAVDRFIDHARFRKLVLGMLVFLGIMLLVRSLSGIIR